MHLKTVTVIVTAVLALGGFSIRAQESVEKLSTFPGRLEREVLKIGVPSRPISRSASSRNCYFAVIRP
jgi:hypothetical protein